MEQKVKTKINVEQMILIKVAGSVPVSMKDLANLT